eukprot:444943-Hanusia_phi.AAC.2
MGCSCSDRSQEAPPSDATKSSEMEGRNSEDVSDMVVEEDADSKDSYVTSEDEEGEEEEEEEEARRSKRKGKGIKRMAEEEEEMEMEMGSEEEEDEGGDEGDEIVGTKKLRKHTKGNKHRCSLSFELWDFTSYLPFADTATWPTAMMNRTLKSVRDLESPACMTVRQRTKKSFRTV